MDTSHQQHNSTLYALINSVADKANHKQKYYYGDINYFSMSSVKYKPFHKLPQIKVINIKVVFMLH